jgi:hypothetical protein
MQPIEVHAPMKLEYIASLSQPGNPAKPNDDALCHADALAAVFDGATSIGDPILPADSDAAWIARKGAQGLLTHADKGAREALRLTVADAERDFLKERLRAPEHAYEIPVSSMMLIAPTEGALDCFWFGDCTALIARPSQPVEVVGTAFANRAREAKGVVALAKSKGLTPAAESNRPEFIETLRRERNRAYTGIPHLFSPDIRCVERVKSGSFAVVPDTVVLLCSDGFLALASDYDAYDAGGLVAAALARGLRPLYEEVRRIENSDPEGQRYPRFKKSDDATALLMKIAE